MVKSAGLSSGQVDLRGVSVNDSLAAKTNPGQKHFHLFRAGVLRFVKNDKGMVEGTPPHISQWCQFNHLFFKHSLNALKPHEVVESVVKGPQIGVDFLREVARKKAKTLAGFYCRTRKD